MAHEVSRRGLLLLGTAALVTGCADAAAPQATPTGTPSTGPTVAPTGPSTTAAARPARGSDWARLSRHLDGGVARPGSAAYDAARLVENPRFDGARPLGVVQVRSTRDVATAISFAQDHGLPVAVRSGGHCYAGWSAGGGRLVLDCRALDGVQVRGTTARIGTGAALAPAYDVLARSGRAIGGGSCATVGVGGLTLGGGVGVLTRSMGLTCDAVTAMTVVTADGRTVTASAREHADLFWALRGGGGGHLGVVTSFTFATTPAPAVSTFYLTWPFAQAAGVIEAWQQWAPGADRRLWSTLKALGGSTHARGPVLLLSGTWTGPASSLDARLRRLLRDTPAPSVRSTHAKTYGQAMASYAGCATIPVDRCHTGPGGALDRSEFGATSHVAYRTLGGAGIATLLDRVQQAQGSGLTEAGISMDSLGGAVRDLGPSDTAFVHRDALMTVQYTATNAGGSPRAADSYVRGFRSAMLPHWGDHAYVNYADPTLPHPSAAYFGGNAARLVTVKKAYDPHDFFAQPQGYSAG